MKKLCFVAILSMIFATVGCATVQTTQPPVQTTLAATPTPSPMPTPSPTPTPTTTVTETARIQWGRDTLFVGVNEQVSTTLFCEKVSNMKGIAFTISQSKYVSLEYVQDSAATIKVYVSVSEPGIYFIRPIFNGQSYQTLTVISEIPQPTTTMQPTTQTIPTTKPTPTPIQTTSIPPMPDRKTLTGYIIPDFRAYAKNPDAHKNTKIQLRGKIIQVVYEKANECLYRIAQDSSYSKIWAVSYIPTYKSLRLIDDDIVTFYGTYNGLYNATTIFGAGSSLPHITAQIMYEENPVQ